MKFSVTIPAYKAKFLKECIESVLAQTYKDFELIIVNDASPEDLTSIVQSFDDPRICYYINETNCGALNVVDNWNKCLSYATGDYIICMGDDDKLLPNCLEEYAKLIEKYPGLGVYHAMTGIIDEDSNLIRMQETRPEREGVYSMLLGRILYRRIQYIGDFLFDRNLLKDNGGFYKLPIAWGSDDISSYIAAKNTGIANMQVIGFLYRDNLQTITNSSNAIYKLKAMMQEEIWYKEFLSHEPSKENSIEYMYWKMSLADILKFILRRKLSTIVDDLANKGFGKAYYYWKNRKKYQLNTKLIVYALIETMKRKQINKSKCRLL